MTFCYQAGTVSQMMSSLCVIMIVSFFLKIKLVDSFNLSFFELLSGSDAFYYKCRNPKDQVVNLRYRNLFLVKFYRIRQRSYVLISDGKIDRERDFVIDKHNRAYTDTKICFKPKCVQMNPTACMKLRELYYVIA